MTITYGCNNSVILHHASLGDTIVKSKLIGVDSFIVGITNAGELGQALKLAFAMAPTLCRVSAVICALIRDAVFLG
eukprot:XP_001707429.1 Hypothetical protein GL50803_9188 [Giardia lamblia ATCC 50803]